MAGGQRSEALAEQTSAEESLQPLEHAAALVETLEASALDPGLDPGLESGLVLEELLDHCRALDPAGGLSAEDWTALHTLVERARKAIESAPPAGLDQALLAETHGVSARCLEARLALTADGAAASRAAWHRYVQAMRLRGTGELRGAVAALEVGLAHLPEVGVEAFDLQVFRAELLRSSGAESAALAATGEAIAIREALTDAWADDPGAPQRRARLAGIRAQILVELGLPERAAAWVREERREVEAHVVALEDEQERVRAWRASWIHEGNWLLAQQRYAAALRFVEEPLRRLDAALARAGDDARQRSVFEGTRSELELVRCFARGRLADERGQARGEVVTDLLAILDAPTTSPRARLSIALRGVEFAFRAGDLKAADDFVTTMRTTLEALGASAQVKERAMVDAAALGLARRSGRDPAELSKLGAAARESYGAFLADWETLPQREGGFGFLNAGHRRFYIAELVDSELERTGPEHALELFLRAQRNDVSGPEALGALGAHQLLERFRNEVLGPDEGALLFLPAPGVGHVFGLDAEGVVHARLADDVALRKRSRELLADLRAMGSDDLAVDHVRADRARTARIEATLAQLSADLVPAALRTRLANWKAVTIIGGDLLGEVPFDALPLANGRALGDVLPVTHLPSVPAGLALAAHATAPPPAFDYAVFAAGEATAEAARRWPEVDAPGVHPEELDALLAPFLADRRAPCVAAEATWEGFVRTASSAAVAQVLVHGVVDRERELPATLVFSADAAKPDGLVHIEDVLALERAPDCVLLTTCHSAAGPARAGDDVAARLAGAFLARGSQVVLEALGPLDVAPTLAISAALLRELRTGATPAEALQAARRSLPPGASHWANGARLRLVGLGHKRLRLSTETRPARTRGWILAALGVGGLAFLLGKRARKARRREA